MVVNVVTAPPEAPESLSTKVTPYDNSTNLPVDSCALYATSQEENWGTTITNSNIPADLFPQTPMKYKYGENSTGE